MRPTFLFLNFFPPLFALVAFVSRRQLLLRIENAAEYRSKGALRTARKNLAKARKILKISDAATFYGTVHAAVAGYLADKLLMSASGMLWDAVDKKLGERNIDLALRSEIREIFDQSDMARFATSSFLDEARENAIAHAEKVLEQMEKAL